MRVPEEERWACEQCGEEQRGEPAARESLPGAELWFCEGCAEP